MDKKINIRSEVRPGEWQVVKSEETQSEVLTLAWAPWEYGLILVAGCADGQLIVLKHNGGISWSQQIISGHNSCINSISWAPATYPAILQTDQANNQEALQPKKFVTGGSDNFIKVWIQDQHQPDSFTPVQEIEQGSLIRSVDWANNIGLKTEIIASCTEEGVLTIWREDPKDKQFKESEVIQSKDKLPFWKVNWSPVGHMLAVSQGDNKIIVYKEGADGKFQQEVHLGEEGVDNQQ